MSSKKQYEKLILNEYLDCLEKNKLEKIGMSYRLDLSSYYYKIEVYHIDTNGGLKFSVEILNKDNDIIDSIELNRKGRRKTKKIINKFKQEEDNEFQKTKINEYPDFLKEKIDINSANLTEESKKQIIKVFNENIIQENLIVKNESLKLELPENCLFIITSSDNIYISFRKDNTSLLGFYAEGRTKRKLKKIFRNIDKLEQYNFYKDKIDKLPTVMKRKIKLKKI
jgi:hypothetical protein